MLGEKERRLRVSDRQFEQPHRGSLRRDSRKHAHASLYPVDSILKFAGRKVIAKHVRAVCASTFVDTRSFDIFKTPDIPVILKGTALQQADEGLSIEDECGEAREA